MCDLLLLFVPQWSPFQPALSLPSLSAWLKRADFDVTSVDVNLLFYEWLFSDACAELLLEGVASSRRCASERAGYHAIFSSVEDFRADLERLRKPRQRDESVDEYSARSYVAVRGFETYLAAISAVVEDFVISPYEFRYVDRNLDPTELERRLRSPHPVIDAFVDATIREHALPHSPAMLGLSCIGQEQLYFALLTGRCLKQHSQAPVVVGGTILSRIFDRGALPKDWFGRYFDVIVRHEGERPSEALLTNIRDGAPLTRDVPGVVCMKDGDIHEAPPAPPLHPVELPVPDFDDLPLGRYMSPEITLPLLTARGCYWGKCEFCHHGMVYGEKYAPYKPVDVLDTVRALAERYGVRHFAFNDEAIPPKVLRGIGERFPPHEETGWAFTGLIKFEPTYKQEDFERFHAVGCRLLYVGLESASERVLELMKKRSARSTIVGNLANATRAGIWMHCFLFFGFPGETDEDARETVDFVLENEAIISSYGAGTFSLEHNAPIFHHYGDYGVRLQASRLQLDVYYDYRVDHGVSAARALYWVEELTRATKDVAHYRATSWVPRELLLSMASMMSPSEIVRIGLAVRECAGLPAGVVLGEFVTSTRSELDPGLTMMVNRFSGRVVGMTHDDAKLAMTCLDAGLTVSELQELAPRFFDGVTAAQADGSDEQPIPVPA